MNIRQWFKRHFTRESGAEIRSEPDGLARCSCCGRTYNTNDIHQVLPHFGHELGLGAEPVARSLSNGSLPTWENVGPVGPASTRLSRDASKRHLTVVHG